MSTQKLPGFTAESSVYVSRASYRSMLAGSAGKSSAVIPAQGPCIGSHNCTPCVSSGPSIFSPGRQFCIFTDCRPTATGGCRCRVVFKGFVPCRPFNPGGVLTTRL